MTPNGDRVAVEIAKPADVSKGGVIIAQTVQKAPEEGVIVEIGDGERVGKFALGQTIAFSKFSGAEITIDERRYLILDFHHIIAIIDRQ